MGRCDVKKRTRTQVLISRLSKAQYVIFLGTTFESHSTSSATGRLGGKQTFWTAALGWCSTSVVFIFILFCFCANVLHSDAAVGICDD